MLGPPRFDTFHAAYQSVLHQLLAEPQYASSSRGKSSSEILGVSFTLTDPRQRTPYLTARRPNIVFNHAEALWYLAGRADLDMIGYYAPRLRALSADGQALTGTAYGPRLFSPRGRSQWDRVVDLLRSDPGSKRATMLIMRPDELVNPANPDVACTLGVQFLIRDNALHTVAFMRGNDAWIGLVCDVFSFTLIAEYTALALGVDLGTYTHLVSSMHLNVQDLDRAAAAVAEPTLAVPPTVAMPRTSPQVLDTLMTWERHLRHNERPLNLGSSEISHLGPYWVQVLLLFEAYRQVTHHDGPISGRVLRELTPAHQWLLAARWPDRVPS
ncbi:thymidylate synthase [Planotetraspora phitsanulokensis]|uniref:thymidylate synthase n=3 Tax=Planotetraspora phitsanulokensis TaxID=575192 RepID=A0A8J3UDR2_9ACTN|nr:thymidylate synthase [Planotetraspora phitsanulokensis]